MVPEHLSTENVVDVENDVIANAPVLTGEDILDQFRKHQRKSEGEDECDNVTNNDVTPEQSSSSSEVESAIDILKTSALYSTTGDEVQRNVLQVGITKLFQTSLIIYLKMTIFCVDIFL